MTNDQQLEIGRAEIEGLTPAEIVRELDKFIIGQTEAKKAVAVALRNRARRRALPEEIREEIQPKNIIMIGPTGVGKTEIARRLAKLAGAPFIKVEATKYTEVGYVGRDVESMIRDLVNISINMVKSEKRGEVEEKAAARAEERLLDILLPPGRTTTPRAGDGATPLAEAMENAGQADRQSHTQETREIFRKKLREGKLDDSEVEVEISVSGMPMMQVMTPGMTPGNDLGDLESGLQNMLGDLFPKKTKKRKMAIKEARKIFLEEETEKLLDPDTIRDEAVRRVEEMGIVFLDEIDKIVSRQNAAGGTGEVSREGVQRDMLPIVEGATVATKQGNVKTDHILFIAAGAFHGSKPADLIPELQGRFPIRVNLQSLSREDFQKILSQPENALTKQYQALLATEGLSIEFDEAGINELAEIAFHINDNMENIGARRLHTILEKLFEDISFEAAELAEKDPNIRVDRQLVRDKLTQISQDRDLSRFIL